MRLDGQGRAAARGDPQPDVIVRSVTVDSTTARIVRLAYSAPEMGWGDGARGPEGENANAREGDLGPVTQMRSFFRYNDSELHLDDQVIAFNIRLQDIINFPLSLCITIRTQVRSSGLSASSRRLIDSCKLRLLYMCDYIVTIIVIRTGGPTKWRLQKVALRC